MAPMCCVLLCQDIGNNEFQTIKLPNNEDKPVSFSRDTQEIPLAQGKQCLALFCKYKHRVSILDDFDYYDQRQIEMKREREAAEQLQKQQAVAAAAVAAVGGAGSAGPRSGSATAGSATNASGVVNVVAVSAPVVLKKSGASPNK